MPPVAASADVTKLVPITIPATVTAVAANLGASLTLLRPCRKFETEQISTGVRQDLKTGF